MDSKQDARELLDVVQKYGIQDEISHLMKQNFIQLIGNATEECILNLYELGFHKNARQVLMQCVKLLFQKNGKYNSQLRLLEDRMEFYDDFDNPARVRARQAAKDAV